MSSFATSGILVEAESFHNFGGWVLDSQFELEMGSPYLLAHGNGHPVADATTIISAENAGKYHIWVRAKDWVPEYHPGRFRVSVNGTWVEAEFGSNGLGWAWQYGGTVELGEDENSLVLHDTTGFCGRCDAIFFSLDQVAPPEDLDESRSWRRQLLGLPDLPVDYGIFDVVVVGGGVVGVAAALSAARLGERVALVHNRPFLGGNASVETGLSPRGLRGKLVNQISERWPNGDLHAMSLLKSEQKVAVFLEYTVYNAVLSDSQSAIASIDARHARTSEEMRLSAPVFIDCSGRCVLGLMSGAGTFFGQESRAAYGESLAPDEPNSEHHGNTVFFRTRMSGSPVSFPDVPWAIEVAKDYADLGGQLKRPGMENGAGPSIQRQDFSSDSTVFQRMKLPLTHFWEYGQKFNPYKRGEDIRDHLLRAIYGTFYNVKTKEPHNYANLVLDWVAFVCATGEFRRYKGDHVLTENDIRSHKQFDDAVVQNDGAFCLHYPGHHKYSFRLRYWEWDERDGEPYDVPFRSLYSANVTNLLFAGKHMSATHVASSNTKFMGNGAQHAMAAAAAAHLCNKYNTSPRAIYENHIRELQDITSSLTGIICGSNKKGSRL